MPLAFDDLLVVKADNPAMHKDLIRPLSVLITLLTTPKANHGFDGQLSECDTEPALRIYTSLHSSLDEELTMSSKEPTSRCKTVTAPYSLGNPSVQKKTSHAVIKKQKATCDDVPTVKAKEMVARKSSSFEQELSESKLKKDSRQNSKKEGELETTKNSVALPLKSTVAKAQDTSTFKTPLQSTENRHELPSRSSDPNDKKRTYNEDKSTCKQYKIKNGYICNEKLVVTLNMLLRSRNCC